MLFLPLRFVLLLNLRVRASYGCSIRQCLNGLTERTRWLLRRRIAVAIAALLVWWKTILRRWSAIRILWGWSAVRVLWRWSPIGILWSTVSRVWFLAAIARLPLSLLTLIWIPSHFVVLLCSKQVYTMPYTCLREYRILYKRLATYQL